VIRVVVDASVLVACALADGSSRRTLLDRLDVDFYAPEFVIEELRKKTPRMIALSGLGPTLLSELLDELVKRVTIVPAEGYSSKRKEAIRLATAAGAHGDEDYVALALALDAPIWTFDKDFLRIRGIVVTRTIPVAPD
jgi:predicted nucleic acid-binding protein